MSISRSGMRRSLQVLVTPLRAGSTYLCKRTPVVAIFISDPECRPISKPQILARLHGLTPAEARLAQILAGGDSLKEASEKLGFAESTVRSQLKSIFSKTNTNRQSELVRILSMTSAIGG
jgi:DNA-binding CsgD family transcriptional regulator